MATKAKDKRLHGVSRRKDNHGGTVRIPQSQVEVLYRSDDLSEWTDEEIIRGARRGQRIPPVIPMDVYQEALRRVTTKLQHRFVAEIQRCVDVHMAIINSKMTSPSVKLKAIEMIYDRVLGKAPEHIMVHDGDAPWRKMMAAAIVGNDVQAKELEADNAGKAKAK